MNAVDSRVRLPRKVLLATDLSAGCDRALDRAAELAYEWHAPLLAVHALEQAEDFYSAEREHSLPSWRRSRDPLRVAEAELKRDALAAGANVTAIVEKGEPADIIRRAATTHGCDVIVMGMGSKKMVGRFGIGATLDRVIRRSEVPVLIVTRRVRGPYAHVACATDLSDRSRYALRAALAFFPHRKLHAFHAYQPSMAGLTGDPTAFAEGCREVAVADCLAFLAREGLDERRCELVVEHGNPSRLLQQYAQEKLLDLVVLGTHGRAALVESLVGSTAKEMVASLPCDALLVRGASKGSQE